MWRPVEECDSWSKAEDGDKGLWNMYLQKAGNNEVVSIKPSSIV